MRPRLIQGFFPKGASAGADRLDTARLGLGQGAAQPLPDALRHDMERTFGANFSTVRVRVGPQADRIGAIAFACGDELYFAPGHYAPATAAGRRLIGHELAHVVQQRSGRARAPAGARGLAIVADPLLEAEADRMAVLAAAQAARTAPSAPHPSSSRPILTQLAASRPAPTAVHAAWAPPAPASGPPAAASYPGSPPALQRFAAPARTAPTSAAPRRHLPPPTAFGPGSAAQRFARPGAVVQRTLKKHEARRELGRLLANSGIYLDSRGRAPLDAAADAIGDLLDTTSENVTERLLSDPTIEPVFRASRLALDESPWPRPPDALTQIEAQLLEILRDITFFAGTKSDYLEDIRMLGLSPSHGGKKGGGSDTQSVSGKRETHMTESKGKVYVTRDYKEASGYAEKGTVPMMVFVPPVRRSDLLVDPRSRKGFYSEKPLPMVDQDAGVFGAGLIGTIRDEFRARHPNDIAPETKDIRSAYLSLVSKGALPRRTQALDQLPALREQWFPILERMTDPTLGPINMAAATIIAELNESDDLAQLRLLARLRLGRDKEGHAIILGYLRGG